VISLFFFSPRLPDRSSSKHSACAFYPLVFPLKTRRSPTRFLQILRNPRSSFPPSGQGLSYSSSKYAASPRRTLPPLLTPTLSKSILSHSPVLNRGFCIPMDIDLFFSSSFSSSPQCMHALTFIRRRSPYCEATPFLRGLPGFGTRKFNVDFPYDPLVVHPA